MNLAKIQSQQFYIQDRIQQIPIKNKYN